jgi:hypothetical protein
MNLENKDCICKGIRFKTCPACGLPQNSFHDFRDYTPPVTDDHWVHGKEQPAWSGR